MSPRSYLWKFFTCVVIVLVVVVAPLLSQSPTTSDLASVSAIAPEMRVLSKIKASAHQDEFAALVGQARVRAAGASPSWEFTALRNIANEQGIDLAKFFPGHKINAPSRPSLSIQNSHVATRLLETAGASVMVVLKIAPDALTGLPAAECAEKLSLVEKILRARLRSWDVAESDAIIARQGDDTLKVVIFRLRAPDIADMLQNSWLVEFRLVHPSLRPTLQPNEEIPANYEILSSGETGDESTEHLFVHRIPMADSRIIARAFPLPDEYGNPQISIEFTQEGRAKFKAITREVAGHTRQLRELTGDQGVRARLAIVLDGKLLSYPGVAEEIDSSSAIITGSFTTREAHNLAAALNNPLDIPMRATEIREVAILASAR